MTNHTPEPWRVKPDADLRLKNIGFPDMKIEVIDAHGLATIAATLITERQDEPFNTEAANARRIVACVNFLADIPTQVLESFNTQGRTLKSVIERMVLEAWDKIDDQETIADLLPEALYEGCAIKFDDETEA